jgi:predicted site-specific integrase-resolvase
MTSTEQPSPTPRQPLAKPADVAEFLNVDEETLRQWRRANTGPISKRIGGQVRYNWADVDAWYQAQDSRGSAL